MEYEYEIMNVNPFTFTEDVVKKLDSYNNTQKRRIEEGLIKPRRDYNDGNEV